MRLKMRLDTVKKWWKSENGTVSMWDLIMAKAQVKLLTGLTYILSPAVKAMSRIQLAVSATQSRAKATISLRRIQQIKPIQFDLSGNVGVGFTAQPVLNWSSYNIGTGIYNTAVGYTASYIPNNNIQFNSAPGKCVLTITADGDVEWTGKPSEAADILVSSFQIAVENQKGVTKAARRRYYYKACKNILNKAEKMEHSEFVDFLRKQVYNRERKVIIDSLKGES